MTTITIIHCARNCWRIASGQDIGQGQYTTAEIDMLIRDWRARGWRVRVVVR